MQRQSTDASGAYSTLLIIWFALLVSQLLFLVLVYFIRPGLLSLDLSRPLLNESAVAIIVIAGLAVTDLILSFVMRRRYLDQAIGERNVGMVATALIVGCALSESVSLFGLLLAFAFNYPYFWLLSALGIVGTVLHFPQKANVEAASFRPQM